MFFRDVRKSGVLLHISSLPSAFAVGDLGPDAERFADFLCGAGFGAWQVLPLNPVTGVFGNSPYSSPSSFAGNTLFVSPQRLLDDGLICGDDLKIHFAQKSARADYRLASDIKEALLEKAWAVFSSGDARFSPMRSEFERFCEEEKTWLEDYALFSALKEEFNGLCWNEWPNAYRKRERAALERFARQEVNAKRISFTSFCQFTFFRQWRAVHEHCKSRGISVIGDLPMFVALDSSDVWANQSYFDLDEYGFPNFVAGVPPDYFSKTGQRWGNPVYRWDNIRASGFIWWVDRVKRALSMYDCIRIDHFRGFCGYWSIPSCENTAENGQWRQAPGEELFEALEREISPLFGGGLPVIAEDLGIITPDVSELMRRHCIPGMKVLMFAFGDDVGSNPYAPHNITRDSAVYTGTHDNNSVLGWWDSEASDTEKATFEEYIGCGVKRFEAVKYMTQLALASVAEIAIIPMQDILGLGGDSRMNVPGVAEGNWEWRLTMDEFDLLLSGALPSLQRLRRMNKLYGRRVR